MATLFCNFIFITAFLAFKVAAEVVVTTNFGKIRGQSVQVTSPATQQPIEVYQFTSIPYAEPPAGKLRFKKTMPIQSWNRSGVLDATKEPNACIQNGATGVTISEDCLFLNIWVPKTGFEQQKRFLSVFVYLHGGGFQTGTIASKYGGMNGGQLSAFNDIVVVTVQYRLGSLGFAYLGHEDVPGNMGLWDQLEALKWVNVNIGAFGGNNSDVTIGGQSSGAVSVSLHLLSHYSRQYFQKAIIQSGTANSPWGVNSREVALAATNLVFRTVCNQTYGRLQCLRSSDPGTFPGIQELPMTHISDQVFHPVVDRDFVPYDPSKMLMSSDFYKVPLLIGTNKNEGTAFVSSSQPGHAILPSFDHDERSINNLNHAQYQSLMSQLFKQVGYEKYTDMIADPVLIDAIQMYYWPRNHEGNSRGAEIFQSVSDAYGDYGIICPSFLWSNITASSGVSKVFSYQFTHRRSNNAFGDYMGVMNGDEMPFVFGTPFAGSQFTEQEKQLSRTMMAYWGNFIKYGDPNGNQVPNWPRYVGADCPMHSLELNANSADKESAVCGLKKRDCSNPDSRPLGVKPALSLLI